MGRRGWTLVLVACLLLAAGALSRAWTPAPPPSAGVQVAEALSVSAPEPPPVRAPDVPAPTGAPAPVPSVTASVEATPPIRLAVPSLGVSATVASVGVEPDGSMTIPRDGSVVGWYRFGPAPGAASGSAVLAGHVDTRAGGPGALFRLSELEPGADLVVTDERGRELTYRVVARETITKSVLPVDRLFARDGPPRLTVITCGGPFQPELRSYRDNVVVVAEPTGVSG